MLISNHQDIPGQRVTRSLGLVRGHVLRDSHWLWGLVVKLQRVLGGELGRYGDLLRVSREEALESMKLEARARGANAILNVRFLGSTMVRGRAESSVLGTAVLLE